MSLPKTILAIACLSGFGLNSVIAQSIVPAAAAARWQSTESHVVQPTNFAIAKMGFKPRLQQEDTAAVVASALDTQDGVVEETPNFDLEEIQADSSQATEQPPAEDFWQVERRELTPEVRAINISIEGLGPGTVPEFKTIAAWDDEVPLPDGVARGAVFQCVHWRPSLVAYHPLYFQDVMLERHGHDRFGYLQPFASGAKFYGTLLLSPYLKTLYGPCECQYALGYYRAGSCVPKLKSHIPWDKRAAAVETLSVAGFFWAAPL